MIKLRQNLTFHFQKVLRLSLHVTLILSFLITPAHFAQATSPSDSSADSVTPLIEEIHDSVLETAGIRREDLRSFQHKYSGRDMNGKLQNIVIDYVSGDMTTEQMYLLMQDLKPELNESLSKNPRAKFTVNLVRDGVTQEEEIYLKKMVANLDIINPQYLEHSVSEDTRLKLKDISKYLSSRYVTKGAKKKAFVRFIMNGSIVGFSIWASYNYIPAAVGVGAALGFASGFFQFYYEAFSRYLISAKTPAGEYARWYSIEVPVSSVIPIFLYLGFNIKPEAGAFAQMAFDTFGLSSILSSGALDVIAKSFDVIFLSALAMTAQGVWDVFLSTKRAILAKEIAVGTKSEAGENARVFERAGLLGIDLFQGESEDIRKQVRPRDFALGEVTSSGFLKVSMAWAFLAVIALAGENMFPGKMNLAGFEMTHSSLISYGGFLLMGASAILVSRRWMSNRLRSENPGWTAKQVRAALAQRRKDFWSFLFLEKHLVKEVRAQHPDWTSDQIRDEVKRVRKDPQAREQLRQQLMRIETPQPDLFKTPAAFTCQGYFA